MSLGNLIQAKATVAKTLYVTDETQKNVFQLKPVINDESATLNIKHLKRVQSVLYYTWPELYPIDITTDPDDYIEVGEKALDSKLLAVGRDVNGSEVFIKSLKSIDEARKLLQSGAKTPMGADIRRHLNVPRSASAKYVVAVSVERFEETPVMGLTPGEVIFNSPSVSVNQLNFLSPQVTRSGAGSAESASIKTIVEDDGTQTLTLFTLPAGMSEARKTVVFTNAPPETSVRSSTVRQRSGAVGLKPVFRGAVQKHRNMQQQQKRSFASRSGRSTNGDSYLIMHPQLGISAVSTQEDGSVQQATISTTSVSMEPALISGKVGGAGSQFPTNIVMQDASYSQIPLAVRFPTEDKTSITPKALVVTEMWSEDGWLPVTSALEMNAKMDLMYNASVNTQSRVVYPIKDECASLHNTYGASTWRIVDGDLWIDQGGSYEFTYPSTKPEVLATNYDVYINDTLVTSSYGVFPNPVKTVLRVPLSSGWHSFRLRYYCRKSTERGPFSSLHMAKVNPANGQLGQQIKLESSSFRVASDMRMLKEVILRTEVFDADWLCRFLGSGSFSAANTMRGADGSMFLRVDGVDTPCAEYISGAITETSYGASVLVKTSVMGAVAWHIHDALPLSGKYSSRIECMYPCRDGGLLLMVKLDVVSQYATDSTWKMLAKDSEDIVHELMLAERDPLRALVDVIVLLRYDEDGKITWHASLASESMRYGLGICEDASGNVFATMLNEEGSTNILDGEGTSHTSSTVNGSYAIDLARFDSNGGYLDRTVMFNHNSHSPRETEFSNSRYLEPIPGGGVFQCGNMHQHMYNSSYTMDFYGKFEPIEPFSADQILYRSSSSDLFTPRAFLASYSSDNEFQWLCYAEELVQVPRPNLIEPHTSCVAHLNGEVTMLACMRGYVRIVDTTGVVVNQLSLGSSERDRMLIVRFDANGHYRWHKIVGYKPDLELGMQKDARLMTRGVFADESSVIVVHEKLIDTADYVYPRKETIAITRFDDKGDVKGANTEITRVVHSDSLEDRTRVQVYLAPNYDDGTVTDSDVLESFSSEYICIACKPVNTDPVDHTHIVTIGDVEVDSSTGGILLALATSVPQREAFNWVIKGNLRVQGERSMSASLLTIQNDSVITRKLANGAVTADKIANSAVTADKIANGVITAVKLADASVTASKLPDGVISAMKIAPNSVTAATLADASVTSAKIGASAISTTKLVDACVTNSKLAQNAITEATISDGAVTSSKVATSITLSNASASNMYAKRLNFSLLKHSESMIDYPSARGTLSATPIANVIHYDLWSGPGWSGADDVHVTIQNNLLNSTPHASGYRSDFYLFPPASTTQTPWVMRMLTVFRPRKSGIHRLQITYTDGIAALYVKGFNGWDGTEANANNTNRVAFLIGSSGSPTADVDMLAGVSYNMLFYCGDNNGGQAQEVRVREPDGTIVTDFTAFAFSNTAEFTVSNQTHGNGTYRVAASSSDPAGLFASHVYSGWAGRYGDWNGSAYLGSHATTSAANVTHAGEWVEITMPSALRMKYYQVHASPHPALAAATARGWALLGLTGSTWNLLDTRTNEIDWTPQLVRTYEAANTVAEYSVFRFVVTHGQVDQKFASIGALVLQNQGFSKIAIGNSNAAAYMLDVTGDINFTGNLMKNGAPFASGTAGIADGSLTGIKLANSTITAIKMAVGSIDATALMDGAVTSVKIVNSNVTANKMAAGSVSSVALIDNAVTTEKLLESNVTANKMAAGSVSSVALIDNSVTTVKILDSNVTTNKMAAGSVSSAALMDNAVTMNKLAAGSVSSTALIDGSVTSAKILLSNVTTNKMATGSVSSTALIDGSVTTDKILESNVTTQKMAAASVSTVALINGSVTTDKILDSNVTTNKMAASSVSSTALVDGSVTTLKILDSNVTSRKLNINDHLWPSSSNSFDLGSSALPWKSAYTTSLQVSQALVALPQQGTSFTATASSAITSPGLAFDNSFVSHGWMAGGYQMQSNGSKTTGTVTSYIDLSGVSTTTNGEWLQLQLPQAYSISSYRIYIFEAFYAPAAFKLLGSTDGVTWNLVDERSTTWTNGSFQTFQTISRTSFTYFRLIINTLQSFGGVGDQNQPSTIQELILYNDPPKVTASNGCVFSQYVESSSITASNLSACNLAAPVCTGSNMTSISLRATNATCSNLIVTGNINFTGSLLQNGAPFASGGANSIVDGTITTDKIASSNITANKMAADSVSSVALIDSNVTSRKLKINDNLSPFLPNTYDLGASNFPWKNAYTNILSLPGSSTTTWRLNNSNNRLAISSGTTGSALSEVFTILDTNGNVGVGLSNPSSKLHVIGDIFATGNVTTLSDARIKRDVFVIQDAVEKVMGINGYTYQMKGDSNGQRYAGVIAQEVQTVLPEVVLSDEQGTLRVAYGNLTALLIEAIKELNAKYSNLEEKLAAMTTEKN